MTDVCSIGEDSYCLLVLQTEYKPLAHELMTSLLPPTLHHAAKVQYGTSLANVDWLHGTAESLLTITNLLIVLGLRQGIREAVAAKSETPAAPDVTVESLKSESDTAARK